MEKLEDQKMLEKGRWVIGVSGGGDSMALLDICRRNHIALCCAHVNYHHRDTADRDQRLCERYCKQWSIPIHVLYAKNEEKGNFQANARKERYAFYQQLCVQYQCEGVLVAHQQDDVLETYLMQKQRGSLPAYYGLKKESIIYGVRVVRPLLSYSRQQLRTYCHQEGVPYEDDESNFSDDYERNRVRHHQLEKMNQIQREALLEEIKKANENLCVLQEQADTFLAAWDGTCQMLLSQPHRAYFLQHWIRKECHLSLSKAAQKDLLRRMKDGKAQWTQTLDEQWVLKKEYERLSVDKLEMCDYLYTYDEICYMETPHFMLSAHGEKIEGITLTKEDFPITIRPVQAGDAIRLRFGTKKIHRWFVDRHIPMDERLCWPVMVNAKGDVIFVPKIGCDVTHFSNNPTIFMIK